VFKKVVGTSFTELFAANDWKPFQSCLLQFSDFFVPSFLSYCDHDLSGELDLSVIALIQDLVRFQDRQFAKDPMKAKSKKRYVVGLREIKKFLQVKKITILLLAPDVEPVTAKGGLNDVIAELVQLAKDNEVLKKMKIPKNCLKFFLKNKLSKKSKIIKKFKKIQKFKNSIFFLNRK
jgi:hypothetical protein